MIFWPKGVPDWLPWVAGGLLALLGASFVLRGEGFLAVVLIGFVLVWVLVDRTDDAPLDPYPDRRDGSCRSATRTARERVRTRISRERTSLARTRISAEEVRRRIRTWWHRSSTWASTSSRARAPPPIRSTRGDRWASAPQTISPAKNLSLRIWVATSHEHDWC